jgi:small subunit ribosomal protein S6
MGPLVDEIERYSRIEDGILKYMTVVLSKDVDVDAIQKEIAEIQSKAEAEAAAKEASQEKTKAPESLPEASESEDQGDDMEFSNTDEELTNE